MGNTLCCTSRQKSKNDNSPLNGDYAEILSSDLCLNQDPDCPFEGTNNELIEAYQARKHENESSNWNKFWSKFRRSTDDLKENVEGRAQQDDDEHKDQDPDAHLPGIAKFLPKIRKMSFGVWDDEEEKDQEKEIEKDKGERNVPMRKTKKRMKTVSLRYFGETMKNTSNTPEKQQNKDGVFGKYVMRNMPESPPEKRKKSMIERKKPVKKNGSSFSLITLEKAQESSVDFNTITDGDHHRDFDDKGEASPISGQVMEQYLNKYELTVEYQSNLILKLLRNFSKDSCEWNQITKTRNYSIYTTDSGSILAPETLCYKAKIYFGSSYSFEEVTKCLTDPDIQTVWDKSVDTIEEIKRITSDTRLISTVHRLSQSSISTSLVEHDSNDKTFMIDWDSSNSKKFIIYTSSVPEHLWPETTRPKLVNIFKLMVIAEGSRAASESEELGEYSKHEGLRDYNSSKKKTRIVIYQQIDYPGHTQEDYIDGIHKMHKNLENYLNVQNQAKNSKF
ncbi:unnamed protein product [Moneuplotes crassus]|uniref:START domain-containing protein n=1 Tax=Euplotes crassus TaxID=5936 RepID=A0AAD1XWD9_EUPCR|nr:unnamed protein product [Moneuplotes crassus]